MKKIFSILLLGFIVAIIHSCSDDDDFPVPPASTSPEFSVVINNNEFAPATVTFTNKSVIPERAGEVAYYWNFGDGNSSTETSPSHLYEEPGAYKVNLVAVTQGSLEVSEITRSIVIKDPNATGVRAFFSDGSSIFTAFINSQAPISEPLGITGLGDVYGMVVDTLNNKLYIADYDAGKIFRSNLDGSNFEEFRSGIGDPDGLAIDYDANQIYWDTSDGVRRGNLNDTNVNQFEEFVTGQGNDPEGIAIDAVNNKLYWNNYTGGVWSKNLDGSGESEIISTGGGGAIIVVDNKIYFDDFAANYDTKLKSANLDGTGVATVAVGISRRVYGIAFDSEEQKIYWVDRYEGTIVRSNLDGSSPEIWFKDEAIETRAIAIGKKL